jgi:SAM-dependent methyltransferase
MVARMANAAPGGPKPCRFCGAPLSVVFADLGMCPIANSLVPEHRLAAMEPFYPLRAFVCERCFLVQAEEFEAPEGIFSDYTYFSSYSTSWLAHCQAYTDQIVERLSLGPQHTVVEVGSNDGYLLQYFHERGIRVIGVEPAANVAQEAIVRGIPTIVRFFGTGLAEELRDESSADLLIGNNVLAHMPDVNDFVAGLKTLLKPTGVATVEFPHLMRLVEENQFDTIYHEHFSYFSFLTVRRVFEAHGLRIFDVEELPTHGGSLRIFGCHAAAAHAQTGAAASLAEREREAGYDAIDLYLTYAERVRASKREFLEFLIALKRDGKRIAGYGAPAKGNTLLNFCGVRTDFIDFTVDRNPHKQGLMLPGTHIPILAPEALAERRPDVVLILPWNLREEIVEQLAYIRDWGGQFAVRAPAPRLF